MVPRPGPGFLGPRAQSCPLGCEAGATRSVLEGPPGDRGTQACNGAGCVSCHPPPACPPPSPPCPDVPLGLSRTDTPRAEPPPRLRLVAVDIFHGSFFDLLLISIWKVTQSLGVPVERRGGNTPTGEDTPGNLAAGVLQGEQLFPQHNTPLPPINHLARKYLKGVHVLSGDQGFALIY